MNNLKEQLTRWIDADRDTIIAFLCDFVRARSPNPPGDTTLAAAHVTRFLEAHQLPFRVIAPQPTMPNIVGSFEGPVPGHHLVLNGHMDVFPVDEHNEQTTLDPSLPVDVTRALASAAAAIDEAQGPGAKDVVPRVTVNIGVIQGGLKVNIVPGTCWFEADIRLPPGLGKDQVMAKIRQILVRYPEATVEELNYSAPSIGDPNHEMVGILRANAMALGRPAPAPIVSLGGTDARLWRQRGVPGLVHGPFPRGMAQADEHVDIEEYLHIVRMHVLSAFDYLSHARE